MLGLKGRSMNALDRLRNELLAEKHRKLQFALDWAKLGKDDKAEIAQAQADILDWAAGRVPHVPMPEAWACECGTDNDGCDKTCVACWSDRPNKNERKD